MKRALLIGINYIGTPDELRGCINDVINVNNWLTERYPQCEVHTLTDKTAKKPTRKNILDEVDWLLNQADLAKGDVLYLHYSGHGAYIPDRSGDEADHLDEVIVPLDTYVDENELKNVIVDDEINAKIDLLPEGIKLYVVFDCCHSGTLCDLRYSHRTPWWFGDRMMTTDRNYEETAADVISLSGCLDHQTSADAWLPQVKAAKMTKGLKDNAKKYREVQVDYKYQGALTAAYLAILRDQPKISCEDLLLTLRKRLKRGSFDQVPQLCTGRKYDVKLPWCV